MENKEQLIYEARHAGIENPETRSISELRRLLVQKRKEYPLHTPDGKVITKTTHEDGRKDVNIQVNMLDVKETDEATLKAKEHIEKNVIPQLANADVLVVVVHKPTNVFSQRVVKAPHIRKFAEVAVKSHGKPQEEYVIVEHHITNGTVNVSTL